MANLLYKLPDNDTHIFVHVPAIVSLGEILSTGAFECSSCSMAY